ncbi:MAG: glycosyltransferase family 4 protein [Rhodothermia bacterium]|nr:glycosyltransferase family 4 protein [Rhodothermia bacterium]
MKKVLFVLQNLPWYYYNAIKKFSNVHKVSIIVTKEDKNAPYSFPVSSEILIHHINNTNDIDRVYNSFNPDVLVVGGWGEKLFRVISKKAKKDGKKVVIGMDNPWKGTVKQHILCAFSSLVVKNLFTHAWVPATSQYEYARRLGFKEKNILRGLYTGDPTLYLCEDGEVFQKEQIILFVGRLLDWKGVLELYEAFVSISNERQHTWRLVIIGNGPMKDTLLAHNKVDYIPFSQPEAVAEYMKKSKVFCLPSWEEHFGVVVHEAAMSGCALMLSRGVFSSDMFLVEGYNGLSFRPKEKEEIKAVISQFIFSFSAAEIAEMGKRSIILSLQNTPEIWAARLGKLLNGSK